MKILKRILIGLLALSFLAYIGVCIWFYNGQHKGLFKADKYPTSHQYKFDEKFEERNISMADGKKLNGVLFKADSSKGLILWLPGGKGILDSIGKNAKYYTDMNYDIFMLNYRGFGKSEGAVSSEVQFNQDMQSVYDHFKSEYSEDRMVVFGYSLGTGPAAALASNNQPKLLILQAPYYSMEEMVQGVIPYLPINMLLEYKFKTYEMLPKVKSPIVIFHGNEDEKIKVEASLRLKEYFKSTDTLIVLDKQPHHNFIKNQVYLSELKRILN